jgi:hypothetical protein
VAIAQYTPAKLQHIEASMAFVQVAVVQFSNDVQVEVAPQHLEIDDLKRRLDDMVRAPSNLACHQRPVRHVSNVFVTVRFL